MLKDTAESLRVEVEAAIKLRGKHTELSKELVERYAGQSYRQDWSPDEPAHENHEFEWTSNIVPELLHDNPKVSIKSRRPVVQRELTDSMEHGLNRWVTDIALKDRLEPIAVDCQFDFGVAMVSLETLPGYEDLELPPLRPSLHRISPRRYFTDANANSPESSRIRGHTWVKDREDLLSAKNPDGSNKYNHDVVKELSGGESMKTLEGVGSFGVPDDIHLDRDQVAGYEVYLPERQMLYTIGVSVSTSTGSNKKTTKGTFLRPPRRYFGHPRGPYIPFGFYLVPDQVYPLSPLAVTKDAVMELNAHADQVASQAAVSRNLVLVDSTNAALLDAIKNFEDGTVAGIPNFNRNAFAEVSLGGPNPGQLDYIDRLRDRIDRRSGLTELQRGQVSGQGTATEARLAAAASSSRNRHLQNKFRQSVVKVLENAGYLMFMSKSVVMPIPKKEAERLTFTGFGKEASPFSATDTDEQDGTFYGGIQEGQEGMSFFDLELEIEPYSMEAVNEALQQKNMQIATGMIAQMAPLMLQFPFINWPDLIDDQFQQLNIRDGRKYINFEMLAEMLQVQFSGGMPGAIPGLEGTPRVDLTKFTAPPGLPAGNMAGAAMAAQSPGEVSADDATSQLAGILGAANAA